MSDILADRERLALLQQTGLLDARPEEPFEGITRLAARLLDVPVVLVTVIDRDRQVFKSSRGLPEPWASRRETPLSHSFCQYVVQTGEALVVSDARLHPLLRDNLAIPDLGAVAYCGVPLVTQDGVRLGALSAVDTRPRTWTELEIWTLTQLAALVLNEVAARLTAHQRERELSTLHHREESLRALAEHAPDVIARFDRDGRHVFINPAVEKLTGRPPSHYLGRTHQELEQEPENVQQWVGAIASVFETRGEHCFEWRHRTGEGALLLQTQLLPEFDRSGRVQFVLSVTRDVTAAKEAEERLRESERRLSLALTGAGQGFWDWNVASCELFLSPELLRLLGYEPGELEPHTRTWERLVHPDDREAALRTLREALASGAARCAIEHRLQHRSGEWRWFAASGSVVQRNEQEGAERLIGLVQDITDLRRLQDQLRQAQKMEAVGQLAGGVAHDFNNLLTAIVGHTEILVDHLAGDPEALANLEEIQRAAGRATSLTRQLLAFGRKQLLTPRVIDLNATVQSGFGMLRRLVREDVVLELALEPDLATVKADPNQIHQALLNLVLNASQAVPRAAGRIVICTRTLVVDEHGLQAHPFVLPGRYSTACVEDNGPGIPRHILTHIFEPFFTTKPVGEGTGLGLSTVYGIMKQSGGYVLVDTRVGRGTSFTLVLPAGREAAEVESATPRDTERAHGGGLVLVAEDDPQVRAIARITLERAGFRVVVASDGEDALAVVAQQQLRPDVLVTDLIMPRKGGRELALALRSAQPDLRVVYMSGYAGDPAGEAPALDAQAVFLHKPFRPDTLARAVRDALEAGG